MSAEWIRTLVLAGGPCGGKTTALPVLAEALRNQGYAVFTVSETATALMSGGLTPGTVSEQPGLFFLLRTRHQLEREDIYRAAGRAVNAPAVILCDRGAPDCRAYAGAERYAAMLGRLGTTEGELMGRYDGVIFLDSAAVGRPECYRTTEFRWETAEQAAQVNGALSAVWSEHPAFVRIPCCEEFDEKLRRVIAAAEGLIADRIFAGKCPGAVAKEGGFCYNAEQNGCALQEGIVSNKNHNTEGD